MSAPIVRCLPIGAPDRGHLAQARRSLSAQGFDVDDDTCARLLWLARALPVAVLALADQRAEAPLDRTRLVRPRVVVVRQAVARRELVGISLYAPEHDELSVRFVDPTAPERPAAAIVAFTVEREDRDAPIVHRFVHGPR